MWRDWLVARACVGWIRQRTDLRLQIEFEKGRVKLNNLPVFGGHWLNVDGMCDWGVDVNRGHEFLAIAEAECVSQRGVNFDKLNILIAR